MYERIFVWEHNRQVATARDRNNRNNRNNHAPKLQWIHNTTIMYDNKLDSHPPVDLPSRKKRDGYSINTEKSELKSWKASIKKQ